MKTSAAEHIVIVGPAHPLRGGIAAFNERLAMALQDEGHQVTIYTFAYQYPGFLFPGKTQYSTDPAPKNLNIQVKVHSVNPFNWYKIGREIKELAPDRLILRFWIPFMAPCLGKIGRIVKKNNKTRITGLLDNIIPHEKRMGDVPLTRYFTATCDDFMSMSHQVTNDLKQFSATPCRYSPHPVYDHYGIGVTKEEAAEQLGLDANGKYLLFFGLVRKYKGLDMLIESFARSEEAKKQYKLIVAGEFYDDPTPYFDQIKNLGIEDLVIIRNQYIPDNQIKYYFSIADLITQTYRTATQSGISQLAFHFEKPLLVTRVGGLGEIVIDGKTGYVADADVDSITAQINQFIADKDKMDYLPAIQEEKKKYTWKAFVETLLAT
jgi:D-inositol-3-phosphate glycosyltransferase